MSDEVVKMAYEFEDDTTDIKSRALKRENRENSIMEELFMSYPTTKEIFEKHRAEIEEMQRRTTDIPTPDEVKALKEKL